MAKPGFGAEERTGITLRGGETATLKVRLLVGAEKAEVTVYGTTEGVRADPQIGRRLDSEQIDETPILGRKVTTLPLLNAAFRQAKGTGDLFVNATYFVTGAGGRRQTTVTLDGANNDEAWGRQTMITTVPIGAIQEMALNSNAFSAEFGWTSGAALSIVTKSGTNVVHGEGLFMTRPGSWQADHFSTDGFCAPSVATCTTPSTLRAILPVDIPDQLNQVSGSVGGPLVRDRTFLFAAADYTRQDRTTALSPSLPAFVLPADGSLEYAGRYRQELVDVRVDHKLDAGQTLMARVNFDNFHDTNPQDSVGGTNAPTVARKYSRRTWTVQANHTAVLGAGLFNEARFAYLNGDPVTRWESGNLSTTYSRSGSVPFTIGQSRLADMFGHQAQFSDTLSWSRGMHYVRLGGSVTRHTSGGQGSEFGSAVLGTFTFRNTTTAPFDELTLADVQQYSQPINYGITTYELTQWMTSAFVQDSIRAGNGLTLDLGLRYDRQSLTDATKNFAPRVGFGWHPNGDARLVVRGGYGMYYTQIRANLIGECTGRRPRRPHQLHGDAGPARISHLPDRCLPAAVLRSEHAAGLPAARARHHDPGRAAGLLPGAVRQLRARFRSAAELSGRVREPAQPGPVDRRSSASSCAGCSSGATTCTSTGRTSTARSISMRRRRSTGRRRARPAVWRPPTRRVRSCPSTAASGGSTS